MEASALASHLQRCYLESTHTDAIISLGDEHKWRVHRAVLSMSGYFRALMSSAWSGSGGDAKNSDRDVVSRQGASSAAGNLAQDNVPMELAFELPQEQNDEEWLTPKAIDTVIRFLYGMAPQLTVGSVRQLLMAASFFDVPALSNYISDFVFHAINTDNVVMFVNMVYQREFGDPGKLIEDASFAFIFRNAIDIGAALHELPLPHQKRVLTATELFTHTEFQRYKLALQIKRTLKAKILAEREAVRLHQSEVFYKSSESSSPMSIDDEHPHTFPSPAASYGVRETLLPGAAGPARGVARSADFQMKAPQEIMQTSDHSHSPPRWTTSASSASLEEAENNARSASRTPPNTPTYSGEGVHNSRAAARGAADSLHEGTKTLAAGLSSEPTLRLGVAGTAHSAGMLRQLPQSPTTEDVDLHIDSSPTPAGQRDFDAELQEIDVVYDEIFRSIRFMHFTPEQINETRMDAEVPLELLGIAVADRGAMQEKLTVANRYNVRRLSELNSLDAPDAVAVQGTSWAAFRFGVEVKNVFAETNAPSSERETTTVASERTYFAGSLWCLDLKRYTSREDKGEYVAVYLRRRNLRNTAFAGAGLFEDRRERTTAAFSIRLCGAPGAPTTNSVCGRSVMGKSFGCDTETSWGWETYISSTHLTEKPWSLGDSLRFMIHLDLL